ncbi:MAG: ATP-binding protein [Methylacidiphilales bacterium]|nr:ATP-binding protein [Candidatus Methylacidiphilales bacterium]
MTVDSDALRFSQTLRSAILLPLAVIFLTALLLLSLVLWLFHDMHWSYHSYRVLVDERDSQTRVCDSQDNMRGYLLTGDESFVRAFEADQNATNVQLDQLKQMVQDNPAQVSNAEDIIQAKDLWFDYAKTLVARRVERPIVNPQDIEMGKTLMDGVEAKYEKFNQTEIALQEERLRRVHQMQSIVTYGGGALLVLLSLSIAQVVRRQFMKLAGEYRRALTIIEDRAAALARSEADLEEQKEWFHVTLKSIGDGVIVADPEGRVVFMNEESERLTGWTSTDALLKPLPEVFKIVNEETRVPVENPVAKVFREKKVVGLANHTVLISRVGQEWPIEDSAAPIYDAKEKVLGVVLVFHNATEMRHTQRTLRAYSQNLEREVAERTTTLQQAVIELEAFSYTISHDLRSPLRAMQGFAQAVVEDYADKLDEQGKNYLLRIRNAAERLDRLIQDLLAYTRLSQEKAMLGPLDLDKIVREIIEHYPNLHLPAAQVEVVGTLPKIMGLEAALTQVLSNLLGNAAKFVAPGTEPRIKVWCEDHGEKVRLWIQDNGIGIAPRDFERIFQMFVQVNEPQRYGGTGMGLAIVRKAVQSIQGSVGVESEEGQGSKFWVELNRAT